MITREQLSQLEELLDSPLQLKDLVTKWDQQLFAKELETEHTMELELLDRTGKPHTVVGVSFLDGVFAYHKSLNKEKSWTITHIGTGESFCYGGSRTNTLRAVKYLEEHMWAVTVHHLADVKANLAGSIRHDEKALFQQAINLIVTGVK